MDSKHKHEPDKMAHDDKMELGNQPTQLQDLAAARSAQTVKLPMATPVDPDPVQTAPEKPPMQHKAPQRTGGAAPAPENATRVLLPENWGQQPARDVRAGTGSSGAARAPEQQGAAQQHAPVVGFLVVVDGPGRGNYRGIYAGSNTIGRNANQRIQIDFGDDTISGDQQAFLVYDSRTRQFQLVPNLGKPNLVHLNDEALLTNMLLKAHDKITMGSTMLLFVPLCGPDFEWSAMPA